MHRCRIRIAPDEGGYIAKVDGLPLFGYGTTSEEAVSNLKCEIKSLADDLREDDNFTDDWIPIKKLCLTLSLLDSIMDNHPETIVKLDPALVAEAEGLISGVKLEQDGV